MTNTVKAKVYKSGTGLHPIITEQNNKLNDQAKVKKSEGDDDKRQLKISSYGVDIIDPPYDPEMLILLCDQSSILQQCIDAYKTNIVGFGLESQSKEDLSSLKDAEKKEAEKERQKLRDYLNYINLETPIEEVLELVEDDLEKTGNGYIEILRSSDGSLSTFEHIPATNMRLCKKDKDDVDVERAVEMDGNTITKTIKKKFRRYVQVAGHKKVYFKEYGHPQDLNYSTGEYGKDIDFKDRASEILHFKIGNEAYGKPRWIGNVINVVGARKAEELNYLYFKNGRHMPAAITISNGILDEESRNSLEEYMSNAQGVENGHKFLLLEAMGETLESNTGEEKATPAKIDIKDLAQIIQQDALFLDYDERTRKKIRSSFRLPPIYTGESQDYNKATSDTARELTEEQVFQPERKKLARRLNAVLLPELEITRARVTFKNADFRDSKEIAKALEPFISANAVSPNDLRPLLEELLGVKLEQWEEVYNRPLSEVQLNHNHPYEIDEAAVNSGVPIEKHQADIATILKDLRDYIEEKENE